MKQNVVNIEINAIKFMVRCLRYHTKVTSGVNMRNLHKGEILHIFNIKIDTAEITFNQLTLSATTVQSKVVRRLRRNFCGFQTHNEMFTLIAIKFENIYLSSFKR